MKLSDQTLKDIDRAFKALNILDTVIVVDGIEVKCYPDNDGGSWYYHPKTGEIVIVRD